MNNPWALGGSEPKVTGLPGMSGAQATPTDPFLASVTSGLGQLGTDFSSALSGIQDSSKAQAGLQNQMTATQNLDSHAAYPSFPNSMGLGSQGAYAAPATSTTTGGLNPWSLTGPALAR